MSQHPPPNATQGPLIVRSLRVQVGVAVPEAMVFPLAVAVAQGAVREAALAGVPAPVAWAAAPVEPVVALVRSTHVTVQSSAHLRERQI